MVTSKKFIKRLQVSYTSCHGGHVGTVPKKSCGEWTLVYEKNFFCSKKFAWLLTTWLKMTYQTIPQEITAQISSTNSKVKLHSILEAKKRLQKKKDRTPPNEEPNQLYLSWKKLEQYSCVLFADCGSNHPSSSTEQLTQSIHGQTRPRRPRRPWTRAVFSNLQRKGLEKRFQVQKYLTKADRHQLASMLGLSDNQVKVWFQNRRMKWRQEARESVTSTNTEAEDEKSWQRWPSFWSCPEDKKV